MNGQMQIGAQALLDFNTRFDQQKLDTLELVIAAMYSPNRKEVSCIPFTTFAQIEEANRILNEFKMNENAWMTVDSILQHAKTPNTKFFGLQMLDDAVNVSRLLISQFELN